MPATYLWLRQILAQLLPELENLPAGPQGAAQAQAWFQRLLARFVERGLETPAQQKNRVVDARNAIRARFGPDHPALAHVGFDESTWQAINLPTHDRTEARNENQRLLRHPEKIVARAAKLLASPRFEDLAVGLGLTVGRRISELLDAHARLEPATAWSVYFTGQRKHRGEREDFAFEIPTLAPAETVLAAWTRLQVMLGDQGLDPQEINNRYGHEVNQAADRHFRGLVPPRLPRPPKGKAGSLDDPHARERPQDALYLHLFRAVYATIAVHWFCPPRVNRLVYKAEIQGHRQILESQGTMRRAYTASRHYDDYQIADESGENLDGRQGIKLGKLPGLEVLRVFQPSPPAPLLQPSTVSEEGTGSPALAPATQPPPATMDPAAPAAPTPDSSPVPPTDAAPDGGEAPAAPLAKPAKKPRPITYRLYPADRPRLDAFRTDPKQSQADNLQGVLDLLENASAAIQAQEQSQTQLQQAQAHAEQAAAERDQALREREEGRQQAQGLSQEVQELRERLAAQEQEIQRLQAALAQERARVEAAANGAAGGAAPLAQAVLARELLNLAMDGQCQGELQTRLIALATQALGGGTGGQPSPEKRQDVAGQPGATKAAGGPRKVTKSPVDQGRFGPLFAAKGAAAGPPPLPAQTQAAPDAASAPPPTATTATRTQEGAAAQEPADATDQAATGPVEGPPPSSEEPADEAQEPPGALRTALAPPTLPPTPKRRGGAAEKLEKALAAVIAHNEAQTARERKWAVTESALARLTGCFRPAIRTFFAEHAQAIEAHNHKHHLLPGLNAARGRRDQQIEEEVRWRGEAAEGGTAEAEVGTADEG